MKSEIQGEAQHFPCNDPERSRGQPTPSSEGYSSHAKLSTLATEDSRCSTSENLPQDYLGIGGSLFVSHSPCRPHAGSQIVLDATFGIIDLGYVLVHPICKGNIHENENPLWLEVLGRVSLAITSLFLLEIPFTMWALGFQWFIPFGPVQHASLHLFDAIVIVTTFVLEVVLRPRESELAGLLIILRLWRIVKVVAGVHHHEVIDIEPELTVILEALQLELRNWMSRGKRS